jgi:type IV secretion system protein VirD4
VIAVVMPLEYSESYGAIVRLAMGCAVWAMQRGELARAPALFAIDEAAALGKIPRFPSWLATLRKYRARLWPIFQNVGQVKALYGGEWQTFIANCGLKQFLGIGDIETAEYVEKLLGYTTVTTRSSSSQGGISTSETRRALLTMEEVLRLRPRDQLAFVEAHKPLKLGKTPYWEQPAVKARALPNPYHKGTPRAGWRTTGTGLRQALMRTALWALTPHPVAAVLYLLAAAAVIVPQVAG